MNKKLLTKVILATALTTSIIPTINNSNIVYANGKVGTAAAQGQVYNANGYLKGAGGYINTGINDINNSDFNYTTEKLDFFYKPCYSQSLVNEINAKEGKAFLASDPEGKNKVDVSIKAINTIIYGEQGTLIIANNERKRIKRGTYYLFITDDNGYYQPYVLNDLFENPLIVKGNDISPMDIETSYVLDESYMESYTGPIIDLTEQNLVFNDEFKPLAENEIINNKDCSFDSRNRNDVLSDSFLMGNGTNIANSLSIINSGSEIITCSTFISGIDSSDITQIECTTIDMGLLFLHDGPKNYRILTTDRNLEITKVAPGVTFTIEYK